jgi:hypothetical protein
MNTDRLGTGRVFLTDTNRNGHTDMDHSAFFRTYTSLKERIHLQWETAASPVGDLLASPNFGICNTNLKTSCDAYVEDRTSVAKVIV